MKRRYPLLVALALCAVLCLWFLSSDICIGRIENRSADQWSQIHIYLNGEIKVDFPGTGEDCSYVFQYETGRGSFHAEITDADGNTLYSDTADTNGSTVISSASDLTLRIHGKGHGGVFSLVRLDRLLGPNENPYDPDALLGEGFHSGGTFTVIYECQKIEGKRVNFFVENQGTEAVILTINGSYSRIIPAGSGGHISAPISPSIAAQTMTLKCVSIDGADVDIYWKAAQRN